MWQVLLGNSHACVTDSEHDFVTLFFSAGCDASSSGSELERVENQIDNDFFKFIPIAYNNAQSRVDKRFQAQTFIFGHLPGRAGNAVNKLSHVHRLLLYEQAARLQTDKVKEIVDQFKEPHAVGLHRSE